jgi:hypothetical protein
LQLFALVVYRRGIHSFPTSGACSRREYRRDKPGGSLAIFGLPHGRFLDVAALMP